MGIIEFKDVSFQYPNGFPLLKTLVLKLMKEKQSLL